MESRVPTLREVAARSGVHPSTASRALNPSTEALVNPETKNRILNAADELGYRANSLARGLKTNTSMTIGMLLPDLMNPLFPPIVRAVEDHLGAAGYTLILANTDNDETKERSAVVSMLSRRVDGLILATALRHDPLISEITQRGTAVVLVNRATDDPTISSVTADDDTGMYQVIEHLIELGHSKIAHVAGPQYVSTGLARYQSFLHWTAARGVQPGTDLIAFADRFGEESGAAAFRELRARDAHFTAVVAANDLIAIGCYDVMASLGMEVGRDVSVTGYNDMPFADRLHPPLTTVRVPHYEIGRRAARLMLDILAEPNRTPEAIRLRPTLVVRASTAPAPRSVGSSASSAR